MGGLGLPILIGTIAVLAVLIVGVFSMLRGGEFNRKYGNKLMQLRVLLQFAVVMILLFLLMSRAG